MQSTLENPSPFVKSSEQEEQISHSVVVRSSTMLCERTEYDRNVVIHCDVENTSLTIVGNASFKGSIVNSTIMCFGQLRVAGSCQKSTLYARGNISAFIVRDSDLFSEQNIIIHREASDSTIQATASIFAATAKIVDSRISACDGMIVYRVRNEEEHSCELELGNIFLRRRKECILYRRMLTDFHSLKTKREVVSALQHTREQGLLHTPPGAQLLRAEAELEQLIEHSRKSEEEYRKLCEQWAQPSTFRISVLASIDAGTLVRIGEQQMRDGMDRAETEYLLEDGQLQARYNSLKV